MFRESFAGRAESRSHEISCAACGNELGPQLHCAACGLLFPEYVAAAVGRKKARKTRISISLSFSPWKKGSRPAAQLPSLDSPTQDAAQKQQQASSSRLSRKSVFALSFLLLVAVAVAGTGMYLQKKAESNYRRNFAMVTYGIQVGADKSLSACKAIEANWKTNVASGSGFTPAPTMEDEKALKTIRAKLNDAKAKCPEAPGKYQSCNDRLSKLERAYVNLQKLALVPGTSLPAFTASISKYDAEYRQAAKEFKAGIPEDVMEELQSAAKKYRGLRPLLK